MQTLVLADDLTGANEVAAQYHARGFTATLCTSVASALALATSSTEVAPNVIVIDTDSRDASADRAASIARSVASRLSPTFGSRLIFHKIDSTARGAFDREIPVLMKEFGVSACVVAPALPDSGRATSFGRQTLDGAPLSDGDIVQRLKKGGLEVSTFSRRDLLDGFLGSKLKSLPSHAIYEDPRAFVIDSECNDDLNLVATAVLDAFAVSQNRSRVLCVGSAGLARALAAEGSPLGNRVVNRIPDPVPTADFMITGNGTTTSKPLLSGTGAVVMFVGSVTEHTQRQMDFLRFHAHPFALREFFLDEPLKIKSGRVHVIHINHEQLKERQRDMITNASSREYAERFTDDDDEYFVALSALYNTYSRKELTQYALENGAESLSFVATGGTTARDVLALLAGVKTRQDVDVSLHFSDALEGILPVATIQCPASRAFHRSRLVTKAGRLGSEQALVAVANYFMGDVRKSPVDYDEPSLAQVPISADPLQASPSQPVPFNMHPSDQAVPFSSAPGAAPHAIPLSDTEPADPSESSEKPYRPLLAITLGDPCGIGPEIIAKAFAHDEVFEMCRPVIVGHPHFVQQAFEQLPSQLLSSKKWFDHHSNTVVLRESTSSVPFADNFINVVNPVPDLKVDLCRPGELSAEGGRAAARAVEHAIDLCMDESNEFAGVVTAPINKAAISKAGYNFAGHTELLAHRTKSSKVRMMLASDKLRVIHVTTHNALRDVSTLATVDRIYDTIVLAQEALLDLGFEMPRIAVAGINPHCGEGGLFGDEEAEFVVPAIEKARSIGIDARGPVSGDTVFYRAMNGAFDGVVAMYHDQGHIPIKLVSFDDAVNITLGLPIVRSSVDHGTGFDIAGQGKANETNMLSAIRSGTHLARSRRLRAKSESSKKIHSKL